MKKANIYIDGVLAGELQELKRNENYRFLYNDEYKGPSVSLTMPKDRSTYDFDRFPPFFEGLLPEGIMLEGLLRHSKIDRFDLMTQLIAVGGDLVGNVTVKAAE